LRYTLKKQRSKLAKRNHSHEEGQVLLQHPIAAI